MKPETFSNIGYLSILVGLVLIAWGLAEFSLAGNAFAIFSLGENLLLTGAIFAAAGYLVEHLRPLKSSEN